MNKAHLKGIVANRFELFFENETGRYYKGVVMVMRDSGDEDHVPVVVNEQEANLIRPSDLVEIVGTVKTRNENGFFVYIYADDIQVQDIDELGFINDIELSGIVCKKPNLRITPSGREVSDFILATEGTDKTHYIPCIVWGLGARRTYMNESGDNVRIKGRFQSREYMKDGQIKTTFEISAGRVFEVV